MFFVTTEVIYKKLSIKGAITFATICFVCASLTTCANVARLFTMPKYYSHTSDKIKFEKNTKLQNVYIKKGADDYYNVYSSIIADVERGLRDKNISIVDDVNQANYILSVNIKDIAVDVDYDVANEFKNQLLSANLNPSYTFDNKSNNPAVSNYTINATHGNQGYQAYGRYRRFAPSALYTLLGTGFGFGIGYFCAGSLPPLLIGMTAGAVAGISTYMLYDNFRKVGVIITYDISVDEGVPTQVLHSRKTLSKVASNTSDEVFYSFKNNWQNYVASGSVMSIGSRALMYDMLYNLKKMIAGNIVSMLYQ